MKPACSVFPRGPQSPGWPQKWQSSVLWCCPMSLFPEHRSLAPTAAKKRKITRRSCRCLWITTSLTPLTAMVIENEAEETERMLADSPPQDHSCCSGESPYLEEVFRPVFLSCSKVLHPLLSPWLAHVSSSQSCVPSWPSCQLTFAAIIEHVCSLVFQRNSENLCTPLTHCLNQH